MWATSVCGNLEGAAMIMTGEVSSMHTATALYHDTTILMETALFWVICLETPGRSQARPAECIRGPDFLPINLVWRGGGRAGRAEWANLVQSPQLSRV